MMRIAVSLFAACLLACAAGVSAQDAYPSRPIKLIVGFPAGTSSDIIARIYAQKLGEHFKRPVLVENKLGVASALAAEAVAKSPPDGYTLLLGTVANTISAGLYKNLSFDFKTDFAAISMVGNATNILVVSPTLGVSTLQEFIALARTKPGQMLYGSAGVGTAPHLSGELFNIMAGVKMEHIPYKGNNQGLIDLVGGRLQAIFAPAPTVAGFVKDGRVKALGTTALKRSVLTPDVPTLSESGLSGFDTSIWYGIFAPKGTPEAIVNAVAEVLQRAANSADVRAQLAANGADPVVMGHDEFSRFVQADLLKWEKIISTAKIKPE